MLLQGNEATRVYPPVYSDLSDRDGDLVVHTVGIAGIVTTLLIKRISTIFDGKITIAVSCNKAGTDAVLILRKYYMIGNAYVDETFALPAVSSKVFTSTALLESVEVYVQTDDANNAAVYAEIFARQS